MPPSFQMLLVRARSFGGLLALAIIMRVLITSRGFVTNPTKPPTNAAAMISFRMAWSCREERKKERKQNEKKRKNEHEA
eukprot:606967-Rhodomonas_salina.1